jgi:hypothetical protein
MKTDFIVVICADVDHFRCKRSSEGLGLGEVNSVF